MQDKTYFAHGSALRLWCDFCPSPIYFDEDFCVEFERNGYHRLECPSCKLENRYNGRRGTDQKKLRSKRDNGYLRAGYIYYNDPRVMNYSPVLDRILKGAPDMVIVAGTLYSQNRHILKKFGEGCDRALERDA